MLLEQLLVPTEAPLRLFSHPQWTGYVHFLIWCIFLLPLPCVSLVSCVIFFFRMNLRLCCCIGCSLTSEPHLHFNFGPAVRYLSILVLPLPVNLSFPDTLIPPSLERQGG